MDDPRTLVRGDRAPRGANTKYDGNTLRTTHNCVVGNRPAAMEGINEV